MVVAQIERIIQTDLGTAISARDSRGTLYKFSACPLVYAGATSPKIGLWVKLTQLEKRPYGFKANKAISA